MRFHVLTVCVLMVVAGCSGGPSSDGTETFTEPSVHPGTTAHVDIRNLALHPVQITITELNKNGRGVVLNETYDKVTIEFSDSNVFRENGKYRVNIRANGTVQWNETVKHWEGYRLRIENNGSVTVLQRNG